MNFFLGLDVVFYGKSKNDVKILGFWIPGGLGPKKWPPLGSNFFLKIFSGGLIPDLDLPN